IRGSMGRVGAAGDNAAMESSFSLLQKNVLDRKRWTTREELRLAIITWIEKTYHRRRRQARLDRMTPIEFETVDATQQVALAACPPRSTDAGADPCPCFAGVRRCDVYTGREAKCHPGYTSVSGSPCCRIWASRHPDPSPSEALCACRDRASAPG